ncbi:MAG: hypothetical protein KDK70_32140, partial [Myxococcales bacterium]|nr:hypothetical protein [Myxococcales bacterium]
MRFALPTPEQAPFILRAFKEVVAASPSPDERQQAMIAAAHSILRAEADLGELLPITPEQLAEAITDPQIRSQIVQGMVVLSLLDEEAELSELELVERFAGALDVAPAELRNLRQLIEGQTLLLRLDVARRVWFMDRLRAAWKSGGFRWLVRTLATLKLGDDEQLAARYQALGELPEGTMGRCYYDHMREQGFPLPGEKGSQIEPIIIHDLTHLLSGYGTDPAGEILTASFSAGNRRKEPFTYIFFVLCQFHLGIKFSPFAAAAQGNFDPDPVLLAVRRGIGVEVDLTEQWDYWADMGRPLTEV